MRLGLIMVLVASLFVVPLPVSAVESTEQLDAESILLSPTFKRYSFAAGEVRRDSFNIMNDGQAAFDFVVYARPYSVKNELYEPDFVATVQNADAYNWVQFDKTSFNVKPGQTVKVNYTVRVPATAAPGGHYGVLFAETQPKETSGGTAIIRKKRIGAIVYATVKGTTTTAGTFDGFEAPFFQVKAPITIRQNVANSGNTDFEATSSIRVTDVFGQLKYKNDKISIILPGTSRTIVNDWQNPAWIGLYKVNQKIQFLDTNRSTSSYVLLVPIWVYLTLVLLIGARVLYAVSARRKRKK